MLRHSRISSYMWSIIICFHKRRGDTWCGHISCSFCCCCSAVWLLIRVVIIHVLMTVQCICNYNIFYSSKYFNSFHLNGLHSVVFIVWWIVGPWSRFHRLTSNRVDTCLKQWCQWHVMMLLQWNTIPHA